MRGRFRCAAPTQGMAGGRLMRQLHMVILFLCSTLCVAQEKRSSDAAQRPLECGSSKGCATFKELVGNRETDAQSPQSPIHERRPSQQVGCHQRRTPRSVPTLQFPSDLQHRKNNAESPRPEIVACRGQKVGCEVFTSPFHLLEMQDHLSDAHEAA